MFWCKTILGNDFTPHRMFGCAWKIKFSGKAFQLIVCFMALTRKLVYIFIFTTNHFRVSDAQRERERERKLSIHPKLIAPQHRRHHISRTTTKIASPPKIDPPKLIHRRLHHPRPIAPHRRPIHLDRSHPNRSTEDRITPDRLHPIEIASPPKTNPPKTDLIGAIVTHD